MSKRIDAIMRRFIDELREAFMEEAVETFNKRGRDRLTKDAPAAHPVKRTPQQLDKTANQFLRFVKAGGSAHTVEQIAKGLGIDTKDLRLPIQQLKGQGLLRTTGHHRSTRYYAKEK